MTTAELNIFVRIRAAEAQRQLAYLRTQLAITQAEVAKARATSNGAWFERLSKDGSRLQWIGRQITFNLTAPIALATGMAIKWGLENEAALKKMEKTYGEAGMSAQQVKSEVAALDRAFTQLSNKFGESKAAVAEVAAAWSAAGSSGLALAKSTELTLSAMVIGEMNAADATNALIAIQAQYGLSTSQLTDVLHQLNAVENVTGTTLGGLITGFAKAAGVARSAGIDTGELAAMIAALTPAAGSAAEAGNGLKTMISRMMAPTGDAMDIMRELGINIEGTGWQSMTASERIKQLALSFEGATQPQKNVAASIIASRWQINKFEVLTREMTATNGYYAKSMDIVNNKYEVQKIAERELLTVLSSNPAKVKTAANIMKNALTDAFVPLIPVFVQILQWFAKLATAFQQINPGVRTLIIVILLLLATLGPLVIMLSIVKLALGQLAPLFFFIGRMALLPLLPFKMLGTAALVASNFISLAMRVMIEVVAAAMSRIASLIAGSSVMQLIWARVMLGMQMITASAWSAITRMFLVARFLVTYVSAMGAMTYIWRRIMFEMQLITAAAWAAISSIWAARQLFIQTMYVAFWNRMRYIQYAWLTAIWAAEYAWWGVKTAALYARWVTWLAIDRAAYALNIGLVIAWQRLSAAIQVAHNFVMLTLNAGFWATWNTIQQAMWRLQATISYVGHAILAGIQQAWQAVMTTLWVTYWRLQAVISSIGHAILAGIQRAWQAVMLASRAAFWAVNRVIETVGWTIWLAISRAGGAALALVHMVTARAILALWAIAHINLGAIMKTGLTFIIRIVARAAMGIFTALTGPIGWAIAAVIILLLAFKDQIKQAIDNVINYFQNLPPGIANALSPITSFFGRLKDWIISAFNALPDGIRNALLKVIAIIKAAAMAIYELFQYLNPFAQHSPSVVENVNTGMNVIDERFIRSANIAANAVGIMKSSISELGAASADMVNKEKAAKAADIRAKIEQVSPGSLPSYDKLITDVEVVRKEMDAADAAVKRQEASMKAMQKEIDNADKAIKGMNKTLDVLKKMQDMASKAVDTAKASYERYSNAQIKGTREAENAAFGNTMAQKQLQLQIAKIKQSAGDIDTATDAYARMQGTVETLAGRQQELRLAGAGTDITGPYASMIAGLKTQQEQLVSGITSGPAQKVKELEDSLKSLQAQAEIMDLENALKFDPLNRQLDQLKNKTEEMDFGQIVSGLAASDAQVKLYTVAYDMATMAVTNQEQAIEKAQEARDVLSDKYDIEAEKLDMLKDKYNEYETAIRDAEKALQDIEQAAADTIQRLEEEARKAKEKKGKKEPAISPALESFRAAGAGDFPETGFQNVIGREGGLGDQTALIDQYTQDLAGGIAQNLGGMNPFSPLMDWWHKLVDWWKQNVNPIGLAVGDLSVGIGKAIADGFSGEGEQKISTFAQWMQNIGHWGQIAWDFIVKFGESLAKAFGPDIKETISRIVDGFKDMYTKVQPQLKELWDTLGPALQKVGIIVGIVVGGIVAGFVGFLTIGFKILNNVLKPLFNFLGTVLESIVGLINGVLDVFNGLWDFIVGFGRIIVGIFTLDPELIKQGWQQLVDGIKQILSGIGDIVWAVIDTVVSFFKNGFLIIIGIVVGFVEGIINWFKWLWDLLVGHSIIPDMINAVIEWFKKLPENIINLIMGLVNNIVTFFSELPGKIWDALVSLNDTISKLFITVFEWLRNNLPDLARSALDFFASLPGRIVDAIGDVAKLGINLVEGFWKGIFDKGAWLKDKIMAWVKEHIPDAIANVLGISSPSKVTQQLGINIVEGLALGINSQAASVSNAMLNVSNGIISSVAGTDHQQMPDQIGMAVDATITEWDRYNTYQLGSLSNLQTAFSNSFGNIAVAATTNTTSLASTLTSSYSNTYTNLASQTSTFRDAQLNTYANLSRNSTGIMSEMNRQLVETNSAANIAVGKSFSDMQTNIDSTFKSGIKPTFDSFDPMLKTLVGWFGDTSTNVGLAWDRVKKPVEDPSRHIINDVYNDGIRAAWNKFNSFLDLPPLAEYVAKFAFGGAIRGAGTGTSDSILARVSNNEHIVTDKEVRGAGGHKAVEQVRSAWRRGYSVEEMLARYAFGGPVDASLWNAVSAAFPGIQLNDAFRPGASGYHGKGQAIDISPYQPAADWIFKTYPNSAQLIWGPGPLIAEGNTDQAYARYYFRDDIAAHFDHIHWASRVPITSDGKMIGAFAGGAAGVAFDMVKFVTDGINETMDAVLAKDPRLAGGIGSWYPSGTEKGRKQLLDKLVPMAEKYQAKAFSGTIGAGVEQWRGTVGDVLTKMGLPLSWTDLTLAQMMTESSGNPRAISTDPNDPNVRAGTPSKGLMQVIDTTFAAMYRIFGPKTGYLNNVWDPHSNIAAGLQWVVNSRGGPVGVWGQGHGYEQGGMLPATPGGFGTYYNHTGKPEKVLNDNQWGNLYSAASNTVTKTVVQEGTYAALQKAFGWAPDQYLSEKIGDESAKAIVYANDSWVPNLVTSSNAQMEAAQSAAASAAATTASSDKVATGVDEFTQVSTQIKTQVENFSSLMLAVATAMQQKDQNASAWGPVFTAGASLLKGLPSASDIGIDKNNKILTSMYGLLTDVAPTLLNATGKIAPAIENLMVQNGPVIAAALAMLPTNPIGAAIMLIPTILQGIFTVIPTIISAILDIIPGLTDFLDSLFGGFFGDFFGTSEPTPGQYATIDEAVKQATSSTVKAVISEVVSRDVGFTGGTSYDQTVYPKEQSPSTVNVYGDLVMPNVTNTDGAQSFVDNLKTLASR